MLVLQKSSFHSHWMNISWVLLSAMLCCGWITRSQADVASGGYSPTEVTIVLLKAHTHKTRRRYEEHRWVQGSRVGEGPAWDRPSANMFGRGDIWAMPVRCGHQSRTCRTSSRGGKGESERKSVWLPSSTPVHTAQIFLFPSPLFMTKCLHTNEQGKLDKTLAWRQVGWTTHTPRTLCATRQGGVHFWPVLS